MKNRLKNFFDNGNAKFGCVPLTAAVFGMAIFGIIMIYSASNYSAAKDYGDSFYFVKKQIVGLLCGICAFAVASKIDYRRYKKFGFALLIVGFVLLAAIFIPGLGVEVYGAKRWLKLGFFSFQPSDIAVICLVFFIASYFSSAPKRAKSFVGILPVLLAAVGLCVLIMLEPNMSVTVCVLLVTAGMLFLSGARWRTLLLLVLPIAVLLPVLIVLEPYRLKRLYAFLDPWASPQGEGYQLLQSLYALGSGGWFGTGLFSSRQKFEFLPFSESDFILSIIGEELGIIGLLIFIFVAFYITHKGFKIAFGAHELFGFLLTLGLTLVYAVKVLVNIAVVSGSIPPTGLPLPLISSGSTSLVVFLFGFGVINNVYITSVREKNGDSLISTAHRFDS